MSQDRRIRVMRIIARMNVGGPAVQVSGLMRGFDSVNFDQRLLTGFCGDDESDYLETVAPDVLATRIEGLGRSISPSADLKAFLTIVREIRKFRPDVIHTHTAKAGVIGRVASLLSGHKSIRVHTFHGHLLHGYFGSFKVRIVILIEKFLAIFTDRLLAVGEKVMLDLLEVGIGKPNKFSVMSPGLELRELPSRVVARETLGLKSNLMYCAFVGRVTQIKRPDRFLDVVAATKAHGSQICYIVAGDGHLLEATKDRARSENLPVEFLGWQSDIETVLAAADMVILTSDNEGTPLSLIQAGMAHLPVVSTRVGSVSEIVKDGETGYVMSADVREISSAVIRLADDLALRERLGANAYDYTMTRYGVARLVADHQNLYRELLSGRKGRANS